MPNDLGRSQPLYYLFLPSYWGFGGASKVQDTATDVSDDGHDYDDDVLREQSPNPNAHPDPDPSPKPNPDPCPSPNPNPNPNQVLREQNRVLGLVNPGGMVTVSVPCPEGKAGGDAVQIVHEGASYDLTVPDGVTEGQSFQVQLPSVGGVAASASQPNDNSMHAGSELGDDPLPDTEGLLTQHLQFRGTPFGTQFRARYLVITPSPSARNSRHARLTTHLTSHA